MTPVTLTAPLPLREGAMTDVTVVIIDRDLLFSRGLELLLERVSAGAVRVIGHSAGNPTYGSVIADIFSGRKIGLILGFIEISFGLGSALGAWIGGYLFDLTGSYRWPFSLCLVCYAISALAIHACSKWQSQRGRETSESTPAVAG